MSWFTKHKWSRRQINQERQALASSIEDLAREGLAGVDEDEDESALISPRLRLQSRSMPAMHIAEVPHEREREKRAEPEPSTKGQSKRLGHTTKVRLQAVRPDPVTERVAASTSTAQEGRVRAAARSGWLEPAAATVPAPPSPTVISGSGIIKAGEEDVVVHNPRISRQSVVTVMLASNPGSVVVHYISLHPRVGFTLHLTAPVTSSTPFNYLAWLC